jgi:hypothetical protein
MLATILPSLPTHEEGCLKRPERILPTARVQGPQVRRLGWQAGIRGQIHLTNQEHLRQQGNHPVRRLGSVTQPSTPASEPRDWLAAPTMLSLQGVSGARGLHVFILPEMPPRSSQAEEGRKRKGRAPPPQVQQSDLLLPLVASGRLGRSQHHGGRTPRLEDWYVEPDVFER